MGASTTYLGTDITQKPFISINIYLLSGRNQVSDKKVIIKRGPFFLYPL